MEENNFLIYRDDRVREEEDGKELLIYRHFHSEDEIILCHKGRAKFIVDGKKDIILHEKSIIFINKYTYHKIEILSSDYERTIIQMRPLFILNHLNYPIYNLMDENSNENFVHKFSLDDDLYNKLNLLSEMMIEEFDKLDPFWEYQIASLYSIFMITFYRNKFKDNEFPMVNEKIRRMHNIKLYIEENFSEDISLNELSKRFLTSQSSLVRDFKEFTGETVNNYIIKTRLSQAKYLLLNTNMSIKKISSEIGYKDQNHFSRIFKKFNGISPTSYRKPH